MTQIDLKSLIERLGPSLKAALESGAATAMSNGHYTVEVEHWLLKILDGDDSDLAEVLRLEGINPQDAKRQLEAAVLGFKGGNSRAPSLAPMLVDCAKNAWLLASVNHGIGQTLSSHLLAAVLSDDIGRRQLVDSAPCLKDLNADAVARAASEIIGKTAESTTPEATAGAGRATPAAAGPTGTAALDQYTVNLTERAAQGKIDPVLGRDTEIRQCIDILMRRRQNNPILTGEAGVGKTAVVEGLALRVAQDDVPTPLQGVVIRTLDLGLLQAGASVKGEFENRLRQVIDEVKGSPQSIIMFIDEAHTLIGAGGKEGQGDAANLLKPALARGELRTVAATTWAEYKKYFERDPALTRRFQVVKVEEPSEAVAIDMMRGLAGMLQAHHRVRIGDDAIVASVKLSHRYIPDRHLPDKSVSLLDTACARVSLSQLSKPAQVEDKQREITQLETNLKLLERENVASGNRDDQIAAMREEKATCEQHLEALTDQWDQEQQIISEIAEIRQKLEDDYAAGDGSEDRLDQEQRDQLRGDLQGLQARLDITQGEHPLMSPHVDANAVAEVVGNWTGIPVGKMLGDEIQGVMELKDRLKERVIGQDHALEAIAQVVCTSRAGLSDPRKPTGVFMMIGTSGTGKTETALALADLLYGGEQNMTVINMSEFKEEHKVSMLLGSPPGYVGYGEGGVLTEAARRKPYSVILLDEMEKAHPGVQDIFYSLFDKGTIKDGEGRDIDFKNTMIIMTTNAAEDAIRAVMAQVEERPDPEVLLDSIRPELLRTFKPAFLGRSSLITYFPLEDEQLLKICALNMKRIERRVQEHYGADFSYDEDVLVHIVARCQEADTGARNIEHILSRSLLPELATECLTHLGEGRPVGSVKIGVAEDGTFSYQLD